MKIDKRKKHFIILDTETTASCSPEENQQKKVQEKLIYDLGYTVTTKKEILVKRNYLIQEIYTSEALMNNAYFRSKKPIYEEMVETGKIEIKPLAEVIKILQKDIQDYNVQVFGAYNVAFDLDAIMQTVNYVYPKIFKMFFKKTIKGNWYPDTVKFVSNYVFHKNLEINDLWTMACQTLCNQVTFQTYYKKVTAKGNIISNAETVYNYITDQEMRFVEDHTALSDSIVESEILFRILRLHKSIKNKFGFMPFRQIKCQVA